MQLQLPVFPQAVPSASRQASPAQQACVEEHVWPLPAQLDGWQVPVVLPAGTLHWSPEQQSEEAVHVPPCGWQACGAWQTEAPPSLDAQIPEQHWAAEAQAVPLLRQAVPPSATPASVANWQANPLVPDAAQTEPAQQSSAEVPLPASMPASGAPPSEFPPSLAPASALPPSSPPSGTAGGGVQLAPSCRQTGTAAQTNPAPPSGLGRHGERPQHWSLNWHVLPAAMQHGATPVYPVGQEVDLPPKQRGMPD